MLGVKHIGLQDIVDLHILPAFQSLEALAMDPLTAVSYLSLVVASGLLPESSCGRKPSSAQFSLMGTLRQDAVLVTNRGNVKANASNLHFPASLLDTRDGILKVCLVCPSSL